jgi:hypothetical protein
MGFAAQVLLLLLLLLVFCAPFHSTLLCRLPPTAA